MLSQNSLNDWQFNAIEINSGTILPIKSNIIPCTSFYLTSSDVLIQGFRRLYLDSNKCCVYPEAQTEKDIDCNENEIY